MDIKKIFNFIKENILQKDLHGVLFDSVVTGNSKREKEREKE